MPNRRPELAPLVLLPELIETGLVSPTTTIEVILARHEADAHTPVVHVNYLCNVAQLRGKQRREDGWTRRTVTLTAADLAAGLCDRTVATCICARDVQDVEADLCGYAEHLPQVNLETLWALDYLCQTSPTRHRDDWYVTDPDAVSGPAASLGVWLLRQPPRDAEGRPADPRVAAAAVQRQADIATARDQVTSSPEYLAKVGEHMVLGAHFWLAADQAAGSGSHVEDFVKIAAGLDVGVTRTECVSAIAAKDPAELARVAAKVNPISVWVRPLDDGPESAYAWAQIITPNNNGWPLLRLPAALLMSLGYLPNDIICLDDDYTIEQMCTVEDLLLGTVGGDATASNAMAAAVKAASAA